MELTKVNGKSALIFAATNTLIYAFKNKEALLVDTSAGNSELKSKVELLAELGLRPKHIVLSHNHHDHLGGINALRKAYPGIITYTSAGEKVFCENPDIYRSFLSSSSPINTSRLQNYEIKIDLVLQPGLIKLNDEKFKIIHLPGHAPDQIGIITPDKVCHVGDAVFSEDILSKYSLPYLYDVAAAMTTLSYLQTISADFFVLGHATKIYNQLEFKSLVLLNMQQIELYLTTILELLERPATREELLTVLAELFHLEMETIQYYIYLATVSSFLTYLLNINKVANMVENGKLYFFNLP
ncbi:MAG: MBL fold metallo-hydrolase [Clostridia bacterium]